MAKQTELEKNVAASREVMEVVKAGIEDIETNLGKYTNPDKPNKSAGTKVRTGAQAVKKRLDELRTTIMKIRDIQG